MKKMKKVLAVLLTVLFCIGLISCDDTARRDDEDRWDNRNDRAENTAQKGNISFKKTFVDEVTVKGEQKSLVLSVEKTMELLNILDSLTWENAEDFINGKADVEVTMRRSGGKGKFPMVNTEEQVIWNYGFFLSAKKVYMSPAHVSSAKSTLWADLSRKDVLALEEIFDIASPSKPLPTGTYRLTIQDPDGYILNIPKAEFFAPDTEIVFYTPVIMDADLFMLVNGGNAFLPNEGIYNGNPCWEYHFFMPDCDTVIEFRVEGSLGPEGEQVGAVWSRANDLLSSNVTAVRVETAYIGVAPGNLAKIRYSENQADIEMALSVMNCPVVPCNDPMVTGGGYVCYTYYTDGGKIFTLKISNGIFEVNREYYQCLEALPSEIQYPSIEAQSFVTYSSAKLMYAGKNTGFLYEDLDKIEFCLCDLAIPGNYDRGYALKTDFGMLYLIDSNHFVWKGNVYLVTGEKNFSAIFSVA